MTKKTLDFYKSLLDNLYDGVYFVDTERRITYWNKGAERITGYRAEQVLGHFCRDNILNHCSENGSELCKADCPLIKSISEHREIEAEVFLHHADGHRVPILVRTAPILEDGKTIGAVEIFSDSSQLLNMRQQARQLENIAFQDPLTGVANRRSGESRLQAAMMEFNQVGLSFGIVFLDIDYFKRINDTLGHDIGDQVLRMLAQTLKVNLRQHDMVSRWGGEEFLLVIRDVDEKHLKKISEKLRLLVSQAGLKTESEQVSITVSMGATLVKKGDSLEIITRRADALMYESKQNGRNRVIIG